MAGPIKPAEEGPEEAGAEPDGPVQAPSRDGDRLGRTIVSGTIWSAIARVGMLLFGLVTQGLLVRLLAPGDFGRYSLLLSLAGSVALICQFGLPQSTLRSVARANSEGRGLARGVIVRSAQLALAAAAAAALLVLWPFGRIIAGFFPRADLQAVIGFFAALAAIRLLENIAPELFRGIKDFRGSSLFGGLLAAVAMLAFTGAYLQFDRSASLSDALVLTIASAGFTLVLGAAVLGRKVRSMPAKGERAKIPGLLNRSLWLGTIFNHSITQLDLWVVGAMGTREQVALYAAAFRLSMLITLPLSIVNFVIPPLVVELLHKGNKERLARTVQTVATIAGGPAFAGLLVFIAFGGAITQLVYGGFYAAAGIPLALLSVGKLSSVLSGPCGTTLNMAGGQKESLRILALNFVVTLPLQIAGMHFAGLPGLAIATSAGFILQQVHLAVAVKRRIGVGTHFNIPGTYRLLREVSRSGELRTFFKVRP